MRILAIGDVHGRADLLAELLKKFESFEATEGPADTRIVLLGDMIDRGPNSRGVIDFVIDLARRREVVALLGNHEMMMLHFLEDPATLSAWLRYGALETLQSYGVEIMLPLEPENLARTAAHAYAQIPAEHVAFLRSLRLSWTCGDFTFVHAGLRPGLPLQEQDDRDLLEIRAPFLNHNGWFGSYVVHGHTPVSKMEVHQNRMNIDTGAYATGRLTAAIISRDSLHSITISQRPTLAQGTRTGDGEAPAATGIGG